jgi:hypothetical protein
MIEFLKQEFNCSDTKLSCTISTFVLWKRVLKREVLKIYFQKRGTVSLSLYPLAISEQ